MNPHVQNNLLYFRLLPRNSQSSNLELKLVLRGLINVRISPLLLLKRRVHTQDKYSRDKNNSGGC